MKQVKLSEKNCIALATLTTFLILGILGGVAEQKWAENIYTFVTIIVAIIIIPSSFVKSEFKPLEHFVILYTLHVLYCVAMSWWWLSVLWLASTVALLFCMNNFITHKEKVKSEDKN